MKYNEQKGMSLLIILRIMPKDPVVLLPRLQQLLTQAGEHGASTVSMGGAYLQVLFVLSLEKTILLLAADDVLGRKLQDAELVVSKRAPKQTSSE